MSGIQFVLRPFRTECGFSQRELADRIGVDYATVCNWENGKSHRLDFDVLHRLCTVFSKKLGRRVGVGDLLQRAADRKARPEKKSKAEREATREVTALLKECETDARYVFAEQHLAEAVEALERGDDWTALLHSFDAGTEGLPKSTQQLHRLTAARNEILLRRRTR
jgi:transcriptional regulator with XRE-family HTH domain